MITTNPTKISAYMLTFNNERTVEKALKSLDWVDEIVVVDSFSTDGTMDIVKKYATKIEQRKWPGFRDQYQYASDLCSNDWVIFIDADEEISPELVHSVRIELTANLDNPEDDQVRGYHGHRRTYFLGRWIMHGGWVPDNEIRLYNRKYCSWKGDLHAKVHVDGREDDLHGYYYHYTYKDLNEQLDTIIRYSDTASEDYKRNGKKFSLVRLIGNPVMHFIRDYFLKRGFMDGIPGLIVAINTMFFVFIKYAKLWELELEEKINMLRSVPHDDDKP